jgi:DNA-binding NarL/FixJ family response regulator
MALVYAYFDEDLLGRFDDSLSVLDNPGQMSVKMNALIRNCGCREEDKDELTEREKEVLALLASGYSNKDVAEKLFISIHTVISHRKNLVEKIGIKSLSGLTIYAITNKIISLDKLPPEEPL